MKTSTRRKEIGDGGEAMLLQMGWEYDGPVKLNGLSEADLRKIDATQYWINPRTSKHYTKQAAIDIEELRESLS